jgi:putative flippase GtrA
VYRPILREAFTTHPAPRFLVIGGASFLTDIGMLKLLHGVLGVALAVATVLAFGAAFVVNFTGSRLWVFGTTARQGIAHRQLVRYIILVGMNLGSTLAIVLGLSTGLGLNYLLAKVCATSLIAVANFFAYRHWVFR